MIALTHVVSPNIDKCELNFLDRSPIDYNEAVRQHEQYCALLRDCGLQVVELSVNRSYPDSTFIEDTAVVADELAVMANMGVESRRGEVRNVESVLASYRDIRHIQLPATLEGGDVLCIEKRVFVGISPRTNVAGFESIKEILKPFGYQVIPVAVNDCLHLKSACIAADDRTLLVNPRWLDLQPLRDFRIIPVPEDEPAAVNALRINNTICMHSGFPKTAELLVKLGFSLKTIDISELLKAEAGMTCSTIIF
ncbi:MAG: dimethylargininase, partial [Deltaproteobacteria bacterium]|nr:dimethylargininase [Deltaproteobacteria bacterium]